MPTTLRTQIDSAVESTKSELETLKKQPQPAQGKIEVEEKELEILKRKQASLVG